MEEKDFQQRSTSDMGRLPTARGSTLEPPADESPARAPCRAVTGSSSLLFLEDVKQGIEMQSDS